MTISYLHLYTVHHANYNSVLRSEISASYSMRGGPGDTCIITPSPCVEQMSALSTSHLFCAGHGRALQACRSVGRTTALRHAPSKERPSTNSLGIVAGVGEGAQAPCASSKGQAWVVPVLFVEPRVLALFLCIHVPPPR